MCHDDYKNASINQQWRGLMEREVPLSKDTLNSQFWFQKPTQKNAVFSTCKFTRPFFRLKAQNFEERMHVAGLLFCGSLSLFSDMLTFWRINCRYNQRPGINFFSMTEASLGCRWTPHYFSHCWKIAPQKALFCCLFYKYQHCYRSVKWENLYQSQNLLFTIVHWYIYNAL